MAEPLAYFITFRTYGTFLHGDPRGSISRGNNARGTPRDQVDGGHEGYDRKLMRSPAFVMDGAMRQVVEAAIRERCRYAAWDLLALNVRTNHVHLVVGASQQPERVMTSLKSWATRAIRDRGMRVERVWSRHGSTKYLMTEDSVERACIYVAELQDQKDGLPGG